MCMTSELEVAILGNLKGHGEGKMMDFYNYGWGYPFSYFLATFG